MFLTSSFVSLFWLDLCHKLQKAFFKSSFCGCLSLLRLRQHNLDYDRELEKQERCTSIEGPDKRHSAVERRRKKGWHQVESNEGPLDWKTIVLTTLPPLPTPNNMWKKNVLIFWRFILIQTTSWLKLELVKASLNKIFFYLSRVDSVFLRILRMILRYGTAESNTTSLQGKEANQLRYNWAVIAL